MLRRTQDFRGLTQRRRLRLLQSIQRVPGRRAGEIESECGMPLNTARDHLRALENDGLSRSETAHVSTRGRPPIIFFPVREGTTNEASLNEASAVE